MVLLDVKLCNLVYSFRCLIGIAASSPFCPEDGVAVSSISVVSHVHHYGNLIFSLNNLLGKANGGSIAFINDTFPQILASTNMSLPSNRHLTFRHCCTEYVRSMTLTASCTILCTPSKVCKHVDQI